MKTKILSLIIAAMFLTVHSGVALAQGRGWSAVQAVPADDRLFVKQKSGQTIEGKMIEANDTNLSITRDKKVVNISRDNIAQIEHSKGKAKKTMWALIGAGTGAAAGAGIGATKVNGDDSEVYVTFGSILGAGIGAGVGALFGASRRQREVIYSAP